MASDEVFRGGNSPESPSKRTILAEFQVAKHVEHDGVSQLTLEDLDKRFKQRGMQDDMLRLQVDELRHRIDTTVVAQLEILKVRIAEEWDQLRNEIIAVSNEVRALQTSATSSSLADPYPADLAQRIADIFIQQEEDRERGQSSSHAKKWSEKQMNVFITQRHEELEKHWRKDLEALEDRLTKALSSTSKSKTDEGAGMLDMFSEVSKMHSEMQKQKYEWQGLDRKWSESWDQLQEQFQGLRQALDGEVTARETSRQLLEMRMAGMQKDLAADKIAMQDRHDQLDVILELPAQMQHLHSLLEGETKLREEHHHGLELQVTCLRNEFMNEAAEVRAMVQRNNAELEKVQAQAEIPSFADVSRDVHEMFQSLKAELHVEMSSLTHELIQAREERSSLQSQMPTVVENVEALTRTVDALRKQVDCVVEDIPPLGRQVEQHATSVDNLQKEFRQVVSFAAEIQKMQEEKEGILTLQTKMNAMAHTNSRLETQVDALHTTLQKGLEAEGQSRRGQFETLATRFVNEMVDLKANGREHADQVTATLETSIREQCANEQKARRECVSDLMRRLENAQMENKEALTNLVATIENEQKTQGQTLSNLQVLESGLKEERDELIKVTSDWTHEKTRLTGQIDSLGSKLSILTEEVHRVPKLMDVENELVRQEVAPRLDSLRKALDNEAAERKWVIDVERNQWKDEIDAERKKRRDEVDAERRERKDVMAQLEARLEKMRYAIIPLPEQLSEKAELNVKDVQLHGLAGLSSEDPVAERTRQRILGNGDPFVKEAAANEEQAPKSHGAKREHEADLQSVTSLREENERLQKELENLKVGLSLSRDHSKPGTCSPETQSRRSRESTARESSTSPAPRELSNRGSSCASSTASKSHFGVLPQQRPVTPPQQRQVTPSSRQHSVERLVEPQLLQNKVMKQPFPICPTRQPRAPSAGPYLSHGPQGPPTPPAPPGHAFSPPARTRPISPQKKAPVPVQVQQLAAGPLQQQQPDLIAWAAQHARARNPSPG